MRRVIISIVCFIGLLIGLWCWPMRYIESGQVGLAWHPFNGTVTLLYPGWHGISLVTLLTEVDVRPQRVCLTSSAQAAPNCRLVQFDLQHYQEFIAVEGWHRYWWSNRLSFNAGYPETYRGFRDVLRGYAFSAHPYPFIKRLE